jgi:hypothetical protein
MSLYLNEHLRSVDDENLPPDPCPHCHLGVVTEARENAIVGVTCDKCKGTGWDIGSKDEEESDG